MSLSEDFVSNVCNAFKKAFEQASGVPSKEGMEREFRRALARHLFDDLLGWEGHSKIGEIIDIQFFDDENFPIIIVETKWGVELTPEIKEKLRTRIEELGSVKYGVLANERDFVVYSYRDYELKDVAKVNVAVAVGHAKGKYGLSDVEMKNLQRLEALKRERLVWLEDPDYFERTYKEISVVKAEGVKLLTENLKGIVKDLTATLMNFFDSYWKRAEYSGKYLKTAFSDWLKLSMKDEEFKKGNEEKKQKIIEVFCRETAYVLVGRILFIRICEDKGILEPSLSGKRFAEFLKFFEKRGNVYLRAFYDSREEIKKYYSHLHELGFFDWWWISPDKIGFFTHEDRGVQDHLEADLDYQIKGCLRRLNRFDFTEVDRDILGDVYQGYLPPDERKRLGEFYTPKEVIEYILDVVGYKPDNELRGKKILDPSCGSGSFLVEATQRLMERYRRAGFNFNDPYNAKQIIEGCVDSIYGLDIHPFASFIAEMNLLFQLVDLYNTLRQHDRYYELPRLHIYRTDSLAPSETIELTGFLDNSRRKMLVEETKGADKIKGIKFDYVVGNPPYVRKERISTEYKEKVLKMTFPKVYHGDNDLYVYFIAKGIEQLNENGKLGYIVSSKFLKTRYGENLRDFILSSSCIRQFLDFGLIDVFKEVANLPAILILEREPEEQHRDSNKIKVTIAKKEKGYAKDLVKYVREKIENEIYSDDFIDVFDVKQSSLGRQVWNLVPSKASDVFQKIKGSSGSLLGNICDVYYCIKTGLNRIGKQGVLVVTQEEVDELGLESVLLRLVLRGEDIRKFQVNYKGNYLIFPYIKEQTDGQFQYKVVDIEKYPNLYQHLSRFRERLANRSDIRKTKSKWYELRPCNYYHIFESEKIITPDISKENNFAYDNGGYFCLDSCFIIALKDGFAKELKDKSIPFLKYLLGLLNSKVLEFYFKQISTFVLGRHYRYKVEYLEPLQIKTITNTALAERIIDTVDKVLQLNEEANRLVQKTNRFPYSYFEKSWSFDRLANVIKTQSIFSESYTMSQKYPRTDYLLRDLDGKETFRIIPASNEHIDFEFEHIASYVFEVLKKLKKVTKRELLELEIPEQSHLKNLMDQYRKDKEQIIKNKRTIGELEKQIDDLVYKLYDITYTERRVIEDYMKKF